MKYLCDRHPNIRLEVIDEIYPCPPKEVVDKTREVLEKYNLPAKPDYTGLPRAVGKNTEERIKLVVVDQIASNPG